MKKIINYIACFLFVTNALGQEVKRITLREAFELAEQNSKQLRVDSLKIKSLDFKRKQAQDAMLPTVGIASSYTRLSDNVDPFIIPIQSTGGTFTLIPIIVNQYNNRLTLQQPVFQGLRNLNSMKAFEQQGAAAGFDKQKDVQDLRMNIVQTYFNLYKLQQAAIVLDSNIAQTQVRVDDAVKFKEAGLALNNDVMLIELQKTNFMVSKADVESAINITNFNLCVLLGIDQNTRIEVQNPEVVNNSYGAIQSLLTSSYRERAELKAQEYRTKASDYQIKASKSAFMPMVTAIGNGYYNNPNARVFPNEENFKATWDVGVNLSWNIMQLYTARNVVSDTKIQKEQLQALTEQIKDGISIEVNANYEALKVALLKIELAQSGIDQAVENKRILDNRYAAQIALLTEVLDADRYLLQAKIGLLNAQAEAAISDYKLQRSLGAIK